MSSNITIFDFLSSFPTGYINVMLVDSLVAQNVVALNATYEELVRRNGARYLPKMITEAFHKGFKLDHRSAIADALKVILGEARKTNPENIILWLWLTDPNCGFLVMGLEEYEKLIEGKLDGAYESFCYSMTPIELVNLSTETFNILVEHYIDKTEIIVECTGGPEQEESIRWYKACERLMGRLKMQINAIAESDELSAMLKPKYYNLYKIGELREMRRNEENHRKETQ